MNFKSGASVPVGARAELKELVLEEFNVKCEKKEIGSFAHGRQAPSRGEKGVTSPMD